MAREVLYCQATPLTLCNILVLFIFGKKNAKVDNIKNSIYPVTNGY